MDDSRDTAKWLAQASRHIDTLTYNRIIARNYDGLTDFRQGIIRDVYCRMAEFE